MSARTLPSTKSLVVTLLVLAALLGIAVAVNSVGFTTHSLSEAPRVIEVPIRSMVFADGNPTFRVRAGETVHFHLANLDPGMTHDMEVPGLGARSEPLRHGEETTLVLTFPEEPGRFEYRCSFHPVSMTGSIEVEAER